jgi:DNA-binding transcriptional ArsR family regulator
MDTLHLSKIMKALSNQNRLELYLEIAKNHEAGFMTGSGCFIADIACSLNIGAPTVSHHLKELTNAGLITTQRQGKFLIARVVEETIAEVRNMLRLGSGEPG